MSRIVVCLTLVGNLMSDVGKAYENKDERATKTITNKVD